MSLLLSATTLLAISVGGINGLYTGRWIYGSFDEARALVVTATITSLSLAGSFLVVGRPDAVPALPTTGVVAFLATSGVRSWVRIRQQANHGKPADGAARVIVFGAGEGGVDTVAAMLRDHERSYYPVALLDDDPRKDGLRICGLAVRGDRRQVTRVAAETAADTLLVAIPSADAALIRDLADRASAAGLTIRVLPPLHELLDPGVRLADIRAPSYADLLGRRETEIDLGSISGYLRGKRVLVTGAGGSIGSELCRQLSRQEPRSLVMLDRDESALHAVQLSISGHALLDDPGLVVADVRDWQRLADVFTEHRPQVVFHAAALKHLPLLEMHPSEAIKSNVWGTWNVLEAAANSGVERFVNISTDKAADPVSVLGSSKRAAERLTAWFDRHTDTVCMSVRFGNVLGSRGSVLTTFRTQIADGLPVTVTHPDVTRYFMTIEEAVRLVIQAGAVGRGGEALILDMGEPVRIVDVARRLIRDAGSDVGIVFTGLRAGEKLHEDLFGAHEEDHRPVHPLISHVDVPSLAPSAISGLSCLGPRDATASALMTAATSVVLDDAPAIPQQLRGRRQHSAWVGAGRRASDPLPAR